MMHEFNRKKDFELFLNLQCKGLSELVKYWNCNSRTIVFAAKSDTNDLSKVSRITFLGWSSDTFSDTRRGYVFCHQTIKEIRKEFPHIANDIEWYISNRSTIYEFKIN